ncbi:hypothetical protein ACNUDN_01196 [Mycobacterium sp. smrl_JER01]
MPSAAGAKVPPEQRVRSAAREGLSPPIGTPNGPNGLVASTTMLKNDDAEARTLTPVT